MPRFTLRTMLGWVAAAALASYLAFEPFPPENEFVDLLVGATVSAAIGVGAVRHPWWCLALALAIYNLAPATDHGWNAATLAALGSITGWLFGAPAGWYARGRTPWGNQSAQAGSWTPGG